MANVRIEAAALLRRFAELQRLSSTPTFRVLKDKLQKIAVQGHREGMLQGTDGEGKKLHTPKARKGKYAGASGPLWAPFTTNSRSVKNFSATWVGNSLLLDFTGDTDFLPRSLLGIRPATGREVDKAIDNFLDKGI